MTLEDKVVLITGARRIGQTVATACAGRGSRVAVTYHTSRDEAEAVVRAIEAGGGQALAVQADLSRRDDVDRMASAVVERFGGVDVLVNMASLYSHTPLATLTEALALELAGDQILVNCVAPGPILPPPGLSEAEDREVRAATPLGRWGGPEEIAKAVLFLIETDFVTGHCLVVDGGRHLR